MSNRAMCGHVLYGLVAVTMASAREPDLSKPLTLEACLAIAMERNAQVRSAQYQLDRAGADVLSAWSSVLPNVSATAFRFGRSTMGPSVRVQETPVGVDPVTNQPLYEQREVVFTGFSRSSYSWSASVCQTL